MSRARWNGMIDLLRNVLEQPLALAFDHLTGNICPFAAVDWRAVSLIRG